MTLPQFDVSTYVRCAATDDEGFQCVRRPSHDGPHRWGRCNFVDRDGHPCFLPPNHPGRHELAWFDRPTKAGTHHTVRYGGTEQACRRRSGSDMRVFRAHEWVPVTSEFRPSLPWRWSPLRPLLAALADPRGNLDVVYEYRPPEPEMPSEPAPDLSSS